MDDLLVGSFGARMFGAAELGDRRRTKRLVQLADGILAHPGGTLPDKLQDPASLKAGYRLMNAEAVTHEAVLAPARQQTLARMEAAKGTVLVIHDTTELDYSGLHSLEGLGQIGNGHRRGYLAHHSLAVTAETGEILGLVHQRLARRPETPAGETRAECRARPDRESRLWKEGSAAVPAAGGRRQVELADRGADLLEWLDFAEEQGKSYLVRSRLNRRIRRENGQETKLHDFARQLPAAGVQTLDVPPRPGRAGRRVAASVAWGAATLLSPRQSCGEARGVPLEVWVVIIRELDPPPGVPPLEWILLTNVPVHSLADACQRIAWYERRWIIEEYHKALKTGCGVESLQFTTEAAIQPTIALLSVVAAQLLELRDAGRRPDAAQRPATDLFPPALIVALAVWRYKQPREDLTVGEFFYALARLGGHQNRKHDHPPGWLVLWRGWTKLQPMAALATALGWKRCG